MAYWNVNTCTTAGAPPPRPPPTPTPPHPPTPPTHPTHPPHTHHQLALLCRAPSLPLPSPPPQLFAGHDTSATTLSRCFLQLSRHPEAMQRLREEQARWRHSYRAPFPCLLARQPAPEQGPVAFGSSHQRTVHPPPTPQQAAVVAKHGQDITEAALEDMPYADGVVREVSAPATCDRPCGRPSHRPSHPCWDAIDQH